MQKTDSSFSDRRLRDHKTAKAVRRLLLASGAMLLGMLLVILLLHAMRASADGAETITTQEILLEAATDRACLAYEVVGGCLWMTCTPYGCEYDESIRVQHNIPEVIVTAYPFIGRSSWVESRGYAERSRWAEDGGASDEGGSSEREQALKFKNVDVIGSPALVEFWALHESSSNAAAFCRPYTYPMTPYFLSTLDPNWRDPRAETPWTLRHAMTKVGATNATFAHLYPRLGFVRNGHDYKASLVAAIRAFDIVRRSLQPHVYMPLDFLYQGEQGQWPPDNNPFVDGSENPLWQQLVPRLMSCTGLPDIDDTFRISDPYANRMNQVLGNAWQVWRPYSCCNPAGATLIAYF